MKSKNRLQELKNELKKIGRKMEFVENFLYIKDKNCFSNEDMEKIKRNKIRNNLIIEIQDIEYDIENEYYKFEISDQIGDCNIEELEHIENVINKYYKNKFNDLVEYENKKMEDYKEKVEIEELDEYEEDYLKDFEFEYVLTDGKMKLSEVDSFKNGISYWYDIDNKVFEEFKDLEDIFFNIERVEK